MKFYEIQVQIYLIVEHFINCRIEFSFETACEDPFFVFKYAVASFKNENYKVSRNYFGISDRLRFGDPTRFDRHDYILKYTDETSKIEQILGKKASEALLEKFEGNVDSIKYNKASIIMDINGEKIFFDLRSNWEEEFQEGDRVQFNISFNLICPIAINAKKIINLCWVFWQYNESSVKLQISEKLQISFICRTDITLLKSVIEPVPKLHVLSLSLLTLQPPNMMFL